MDIKIIDTELEAEREYYLKLAEVRAAREFGEQAQDRVADWGWE